MTKTEMIKAVWSRIPGVTQRQVSQFFEAYASVLREHAYDNGDPRVPLPDVGNFRVSARNRTDYINPRTGEPMKVPIKNKLTFKMFKGALGETE